MQMVTEGNQNYADKSIQKQVDKDAEHVMETSKKPIPDPPDKTFPDIITTPTENIPNINPILPNPVTTNSSLQAKTGTNTTEIPAFSIAPAKQKPLKATLSWFLNMQTLNYPSKTTTLKRRLKRIFMVNIWMRNLLHRTSST